MSDNPLIPHTLPQRLARWIPLLLIAAVVLTYCGTIRNPFTLWDDYGTIVENPRLAPPTLAGLVEHWRTPHMDLYVPATYTLWWVVAKASWHSTDGGGFLDPRLFHFANLALHALTTLVVFALLKRIVQRAWPAAAGAMLFALHPVQVETIAWISGAKDLLAGLLVLTAVWQYMLFASGSRRRAMHYALGSLALAVALLAKPIAVVTPLLAVLLDWLIVQRPWRQIARSAGPWFVLVVPCIFWSKLCQPGLNVLAPPLWQRPLIAADAVAFYVYKLLVPIHLAPDYGRRPIDVLANGWAYWTWILPASIALVICWTTRSRESSGIWSARFSGWLVHPFSQRSSAHDDASTDDPLKRADRFVHDSKLPLACALLALAALLPVLGLVPFDFQVYSTTADHYLYIPMFGVSLAAAWALARYQRVAISFVASIPCLMLLAALSAHQVRVWHDTQSLFDHTLTVNPDSYAAWSNLATLAYRDARDAEARAQTARLVFDARGEAACLAEARKLNEQYLAYAQQSHRVRPESIQTRRRVGDALLRLDRPAEALPYLRDAVAAWEKLPDDQKRKYATTHHLLAIALQRTGQLKEAAACEQRTLAYLPEYGPAQTTLTQIRASQARAPAEDLDLPQP